MQLKCRFQLSLVAWKPSPGPSLHPPSWPLTKDIQLALRIRLLQLPTGTAKQYRHYNVTLPPSQVCSQISCTSLCPWQTVRRGTATRNPIYYGLKISDTYEVTWPALERRPWCVGQRRDSSNTSGPGLLLLLLVVVGMWIVSCQILI